jgi:hypothetical protein
MPLIRLTDVPPVLQTWDPLSDELAREWCAEIINYMPHRLQATFMWGIQYEARRSGISHVSEWIWLAKEFHAAGFTPAEWLQLTKDVSKDDRSVSSNFESEEELYVPNPLIALAVSDYPEDGGRIRLQADPWTRWLARTRAGEDSLAVVIEMLEAHWGEPAVHFPFGEFSLCALKA